MKTRTYFTFLLVTDGKLLGWPKSSFRFARKLLQKKTNKQFGQPNTIFPILTSFQASLVAQMVKKSVCNVGDPVSIPGSRRSPREGNG